MTSTRLGKVIPGLPSKLKINATDLAGNKLFVRQKTNVNSGQLPQGLSINQDGYVMGVPTFRELTRFDTSGTTTYDGGSTTFDHVFSFYVEAFANSAPLESITVENGGSGYTTATVSITGGGGYGATATANISSGAVASITLTSPGHSYISPPTVTITGDGSSSRAVAHIRGGFRVAGEKEYNIEVDPQVYEPWQNVYARAFPRAIYRDLWKNFIGNTNIFPPSELFRDGDPYFGVQSNINILVKSGLYPTELSEFLEAINTHPARKVIKFGELKTATFRHETDSKQDYDILYYEVIEQEGIDDIIDINKDNDYDYLHATGDSGSVYASNTSPYSADQTSWSKILDVFPNTFASMRRTLEDNIGTSVSELISNPQWMHNKQSNGTYIGFKPVIPICYTKPDASAKIKFRIERSGFNPNSFFFEIDRYVWDRDLTDCFDVDTGSYSKPQRTTFDTSTTTFDTGGVEFMDVIQTLVGDGVSTTYTLDYTVSRSADVVIFSPSYSGTITGATNDNPIKITTAAPHGLADNLQIQIVNMHGYGSIFGGETPYDLGSMTELNNNFYYIDVLDDYSFTLYEDSALSVPVDGSTYSTYTSGGEFIGQSILLRPVSDYVARDRTITFTDALINTTEYKIIFLEQAVTTYRRPDVKDRFIKFGR